MANGLRTGRHIHLMGIGPVMLRPAVAAAGLRAPGIAMIKSTVRSKPSWSLYETLGDTIKSYALPCGSHG